MKNSDFITNSRRILSCYFYNTLELLAVKTNLFYNVLMNWREPVFLNEIKMAKVSSKDKVLLIGCGIFPSETIVIAEKTGADVVGIDNSPVAVKHAKRFVDKKGLSNKITIKYADGDNFSVSNFNVIFIAINVFPINNVLLNLSNNLKENCRVLCKSIKNDIPLVLKNERLDSIFQVVDKINNPKTQSYLLIKKQ